jgi:hypothetical protein
VLSPAARLQASGKTEDLYPLRLLARKGELAFELTHRIYKNKGEMKK